MKRFYFIVGFLLFYGCNPSYSQQSPGKIEDATVFTGIYTNKNYIKNPSAILSASTGTSTSNASLTRDTDSADKIDNKASFICDASAQNGYCAFTTETITEGDKTGNCAASAQFKGDASLYKLAVHDGSDYLAYSQVLTNASDWTEVSVNYPCGSTRQVRLVQTEAGTGAAVNIGRVFWGKAPNLQNVSQAEIYGSLQYAQNASCVWTKSANNWNSFTAATCGTATTIGNGTVASSTLPAIKFTSLPPGRYEITVAASLRASYTSSTTQCTFALYDGTNRKGVVLMGPAQASAVAMAATGLSAVFEYSSQQSNITFEVQSNRQAGDGDCYVLNNDYSDQQFTITVKKFPTSSQTAINSNTLPAWAFLKYAGTSSCTWSRTSNATFADFTADTDCPTPTFSGNAAAPSTKIPAITLGNMPAGRYRFLAMGAFKSTTANQSCSWRFSNGTIASTVVVTETDAQAAMGMPVLEMYLDNPSLLTSTTFSLQGTGTFGSTACNIDSDISGLREFSILVQPVDQNYLAPLLVGSVTSDSTGLERIGRVKITNSGTPSISSQSGSWVSSLTDHGAGDVTVNFKSGFFSSAPTCVPTATAASNNVDCTNYSDETTSSVRVICQYPTGFAGSGTGFDTNFSMICFGPR